MRLHTLFFLLLLPGPASALPQRPTSVVPGRPIANLVRTTELRVDVRIVDGVATTALSQTIRNDGPRPAEATWLLPLPEGAVADGFRMQVDGVDASGAVLDAAEAAEVYEEIVRRMRDPGLLEFLGRGCLRARVFPVPARGEVGVTVTYRQVLPRLLGLYRWSLPARVGGVHGTCPEHVLLSLSIDGRRSIKNAFSPRALIDVVQTGDRAVRASMECAGASLPADELVVQYSLSEEDFGLDLLSTRRAGEAEGTFLMLLSPKRDWGPEHVLPKEITFVLDTSGSMAGEKIEQARGALRYFLRSLGPADRFNVVPFSTEARPFFSAPVEASPENVARALGRTDEVSAVGGTNIADALARALSAPGEAENHLGLVVFLTDGVPTLGSTDPASILAAVERDNHRDARVFVLGVGDDVNTVLLDRIARTTGGTRDYVRPEESIEVKAGALFLKLAHPVMTDLTLAAEGVELLRLAPGKLPDLFQGERIELLGRYRGEGTRLVRLTGRVGEVRRELVYEATFAAGPVPELDFVPSLWAERRVGLLLDAIRLGGEDPELVGEVTRLGRAYRIVTPYTSHLILEEDLARGAGPRSTATSWDAADADALRALGYGGGGEPAGPDRASFGGRLGRRGSGPAPAAETGAAAVERSRYLQRLQREGASADERRRARRFVQRVGDRVLRLVAGVWVEEGLQSPLPANRRMVVAFSEEYFALLREHPELRPVLSFRTRVALRFGGGVLEVVAPAEEEEAGG